MFIFGHLGIGSKMVYPWRKQITRGALLVGTVLPDLIDKPLYYGEALFIGLPVREHVSRSSTSRAALGANRFPTGSRLKLNRLTRMKHGVSA